MGNEELDKYKYKYVCPTTLGFVRVKITNKQWRDGEFPLGKIEDIRLYYNKEQDVFICQRVYKWWVGYANTFLFPVAVLLNGLANWKETWDDALRTFTDKQLERGGFVSDRVWNTSNAYSYLREFVE